METHGESSGDMNEGNMKTSEISKAKKASDHTSQGRTSHEDQITDHVDKDIRGVTQDSKLPQELNQKNYDVSAQEEDGHSAKAKIQKVRWFFENVANIKNYFTPREMSVGPIHDDLGKKLKLKLAKKFVNDTKKQDSIFLQKIKSKIRGLKKCFRKRSIPYPYNDDSLARLFFLDGCAVLQFIRSCVRDELEKVFKINSTQAAFIQQDLFLFENQIPFQVLTLLMDAMDINATDMEETKRPSYHFKFCIIQFVHMNNIFTTNKVSHYDHSRKYYSQMIGRLDKIKPFHLLDLLHKVSIFGSIKDAEVDEDERDDGSFVLNVFDQPKKCLLSLDNCFGERCSYFTDYGRIEERYLRTIQELKSSGITMKLSNFQGIKSIDFSTHCFGISGHLKLPALNVNDSTVRKLFNLVAYEMCLDVKERRYSFISYLNFLDMLIDTKQDVEDLRTTGILMRNALGSDAKVVEFFNTLQLTYMPKSDQDHFETIRNKIEEHYARKCKIRMARICTAYVRNPWPTLGLVLTLIALLFTVVQTWFAVNPRN